MSNFIRYENEDLLNRMTAIMLIALGVIIYGRKRERGLQAGPSITCSK